ncbi:transcription factor bHLH112 isoform X2 [Carica papaya]|uniref:transcription factor bHLH112 isoform X2 n=1 Tax=Carica papaya TaxID=3649 RepID=UPI000B8CD691|nr:transcription factor bHLH112 isoform X2 [Carica papaya]
MGEEFHAGVCGETWWNSSKNVFASPCSVGIGGDLMGGSTNFFWSSFDVLDMKAKSSYEEEDVANITTAVTDTSTNTKNSSSVSADGVFHVQKLQEAAADSDSTLQMMGFGISSSSPSTSDWNQSILGRLSSSESNYSSMMPEDMNSISRLQQSYSESSINENIFKPVYLHQDFSSSSSSSSSASYGFPNSTLLQTLFESAPTHDDPPPPPPPHHHHHHQLLNNRSMNYMSTYTNCNSQDQLSPSNWSKTVSPLLKPSLPKQQFWNSSSSSFPAPLNDIIRPRLSPSSQSQFLVPCFQEKSNCSKLTPKLSTGEIRDSGSAMKKASSELPVSKRPRIETPSPLPTFKVRKEKLGDRITALQQLVSPFGKTDTASVLHEAIEYIKFLHDQVLSNPYMKQGAPTQLHQQGCHEKLKEAEGSIKQDLRSRGLCLVPISSTFPVANETTADFWTPTFGGTFR